LTKELDALRYRQDHEEAISASLEEENVDLNGQLLRSRSQVHSAQDESAALKIQLEQLQEQILRTPSSALPLRPLSINLSSLLG
jgi:hypothetical protein